jgi:hypothetical protein
VKKITENEIQLMAEMCVYAVEWGDDAEKVYGIAAYETLGHQIACWVYQRGYESMGSCDVVEIMDLGSFPTLTAREWTFVLKGFLKRLQKRKGIE